MSTIVSKTTTTMAPRFVIEIERLQDVHPISNKAANYIAVRVLPGIKDVVYKATAFTNELTPLVAVRAVRFFFQDKILEMSEESIRSILVNTKDFNRGSSLGEDTVRFFVQEGLDLQEIRKAFKGLRVALENNETPIEHTNEPRKDTQVLRQPAGFMDWAIAHNLDDMTRLRKIKESRNNHYTVGGRVEAVQA